MYDAACHEHVVCLVPERVGQLQLALVEWIY